MIRRTLRDTAALLAACLLAAALAGGGARAACLDAADVVIPATGDRGTAQMRRWVGADAPGVLRVGYDMRGLSLSSRTVPDGINPYPLDIRNPATASWTCVYAPRIVSHNDPGLSWRASYLHNSAGIIAKDGWTVIDAASVEGMWDAFRAWYRPDAGEASPALVGLDIRDSRAARIRDDCIENDAKAHLRVTRSFFDGCYVFLSARQGWQTPVPGADIVITDSLVRLQMMPGPYGHEADTPPIEGHGALFKFDDAPLPLHLHNNIFLIEGPAVTKYGPESWRKNSAYMLAFPGLASCSGNVIIWLGEGDFPGAVPNDGACVTVTRDRRVWDRAAAAWRATHEGV